VIVQVFPARNTVHVALSALAVMILALALRAPAALAWAGAMIAALALARAATHGAVVRLRRAGLEMVWRTHERIRRVPRQSRITITAELKNRDNRPVQFRSARVLASRELTVTCEPTAGEIAAGDAIPIVVKVTAPRVGHFCLHGMALEVGAARGSFEVPLAFANPIGVQVLPRGLARPAGWAQGAQSRPRSEPGAPHPRPGTGSELHDLREHVSGDAYKHIAWKASARRGKLMVREYQREDREVVWLVLDAAVEHQAGPLGHAPLDHGIDDIASLGTAHLRRGDQVGLSISGIDTARWLAPGRGARHAHEMAQALALATNTADADRSDDDETEVARRVLDHLRFLDGPSVAELTVEQIDTVCAHAELKRARAPYDMPSPFAGSPRERALRRYLACFGISTAPRAEQDGARTADQLLHAVLRATQEKPRPTLVYVWSPAGRLPSSLPAALTRLRRRGIAVRWLSPRVEGARSEATDELARVIDGAVRGRAQVSRDRGEQRLRAMGVVVQSRASAR
jgi:uncharacterized protein (DUF58 family)